MPGIADLPGDQIVQTTIAGQATAGTPDEFPVIRIPSNATITAVYYVAKSTLTGAATNYCSVTLRNRGAAGAGATNIANLDFSSGAVIATAFSPIAITLNTTAANLNVTAGDSLTCEKVVTGTGLALPAGALVVHYKVR